MACRLVDDIVEMRFSMKRPICIVESYSPLRTLFNKRIRTKKQNLIFFDGLNEIADAKASRRRTFARRVIVHFQPKLLANGDVHELIEGLPSLNGAKVLILVETLEMQRFLDGMKLTNVRTGLICDFWLNMKLPN